MTDINTNDSRTSPQTSQDVLKEDSAEEYPICEEIKRLLLSLPLIPNSQYNHIHDVHCHPTDHPETLSQVDSSCGLLCPMSTRPDDQALVSRFAESYPNQVIPFFGYHPWFSHTFSFDDETTTRAHYQKILSPSPSEEIIEQFPDPLPWEIHLRELKGRLIANPKAQ